MSTTLDHTHHHAKAGEIWQGMSVNEKTAVRFGLFPHAKMSAAETEGYDPTALSVALMDVAKANGGMRA